MESITEMPKYKSYKPSGIDWLGDIPESWELIANKHIFRLKKNLVGKRSNEYDLLSLTLRGIIKRDMDNPEGKFPAEFDTYQEVKKGDFVFCLFDVEETPRTVGLSSFNGMITGAYTVMEPLKKYDENFLYYFYLNLDTGKRLRPLYTGLRNTISKDRFLGFKTFVPSRNEQQMIAKFLDTQTTQIDEVIAIKEKQISLLKERKQIIIQQAVTQGLEPNVPLKDSCVDWIGNIPVHWELKKLKHVAGNFMYGTSVDCNTLQDGTPVLRIPNINELDFNFDDLKFANLPKEETKRYLLQKDDILIIRTNGNPDLVGKSAMFTGEGIYMFASYLIRMKPLQIVDPEFLIRALNSFSIRSALTHGARTSVGNYNLNTQTLGDCYIAIPPKNEQKCIVSYLYEQSKSFNNAINLQEEQIKKLTEYKASLINSAVTGKIKITPEMVEG